MKANYIQNENWTFANLREAVDYYLDNYLRDGDIFQQEDICGWIFAISKHKRNPKPDSVGRKMRYRREEQQDVFCANSAKSLYRKGPRA